MPEKEIKDIVQKYKERIIKTFGEEEEHLIRTSDYKIFRQSFLPKNLTTYEKWAKIAGNLFNLKPDKKSEKKIKKALNTCHLQIEPKDANSLPLFVFVILFFLGILVGLFFPVLLNTEINLFVFIVFMILGGLAYIYLINLPYLLAKSWRMKSSSQMIQCTFYIVTYMRHTSNLENAVIFASNYIEPPLALDLKRVIWLLETGVYSNIGDAMEDYLYQYGDSNKEFLESFHLIESSLVESDENRRLDALDKSLSVLLEETHDKMLHYAQDLRTPVMMLNMLGVVLPLLAMMLMPMLVAFMPEIKWYWLLLLYDIFLPFLIYYYVRNIIATRPSGLGAGFSMANTKKIKINFIKMVPVLIIAFILLVIAFSPLIIHATQGPSYDICLIKDGPITKIITQNIESYTILHPNTRKFFCLLEYIEFEDPIKGKQLLGPYGFLSVILSLFFIIAIAIVIIRYYNIRIKNIIKIRNETKEIEDEFMSILFQLGNRMADGIPAEMAIPKVTQRIKRVKTYKFFEIITHNLRSLGLSIRQAIFDKDVGAINLYPSHLIRSSMEIMIDAAKKGPLIAAKVLMTMSNYVKEIRRVEERLRDLLTESLSSIKSEIAFLAPGLSAFVVGMASLFATILVKIPTLTKGINAADVGELQSISQFLKPGMPVYYLQIVIGIYLIQIIIILTILLNAILNGEDRIEKEYLFTKHLSRTIKIYIIVTLVMIIFVSLFVSRFITQLQ